MTLIPSFTTDELHHALNFNSSARLPSHDPCAFLSLFFYYNIFPISYSTPVIPTLSNNDHRKIAIAVDLSDESAYAVKWAVILLHVRPTTFLYGADWGSIQTQMTTNTDNKDDQTFTEEQFDDFTTNKTNSLAQPLADAHIPFKIHIVKDHDMKERLCLEVERLGLSRGFGAARVRSGKGRLGSVSDYCVQHCVCPVVVVNYPDEDVNGCCGGAEAIEGGAAKLALGQEIDLQPVPEEEESIEEQQQLAGNDQDKQQW